MAVHQSHQQWPAHAHTNKETPAACVRSAEKHGGAPGVEVAIGAEGNPMIRAEGNVGDVHPVPVVANQHQLADQDPIY